MTELEIFVRLLLALGLGALIGSERERFGKVGDAFFFGGIRTFMFISLLGALSAFIAGEQYEWLVVPVFAAVFLFIAIAYYSSIILSKGKSIGATGEIAALLVFLIGTLTFTDHILLAIAISVVIATFLYLKTRLHTFLKRVSEEEMYTTFIFAIIAFVILPFLPNKTYDMFGVLNPYKIWLMVVFISGLSYVGYILTKILGSKRGIGLSGLVGGLVSSTAIVMTLSGKSKGEHKESMIRLLVFAALLANSIMFLRVLIEVFVVNNVLLGTLIVPMITMAVVALICAGFFWFERKKEKSKDANAKAKSAPLHYKSPMSFGPAIKFGLLFGIILLVIKLAQIYLGQTGIYIASFVSGFVDVDAITLSMAGIAGREVTHKVAATAITLAVMSNTFIKIGYASLFGSKEFRNKLALSLILVIISGLVAIWLL